MYRFLLKPQWLALTLLVVLAIPACVLMGLWQLGRFEGRVDDSKSLRERPTAAAVPVARTLADGSVRADSVNRTVTVTGRYDSAHQLLVPDRTVHGRTGYYVLTPVRGGDGKRAVPVVRGWTASAADVPQAPSGRVTVRGTVRAAENDQSPGVRPNAALPSGQIGMIAGSTLVNVLPYPVSNAWVTASTAPHGLTPVPVSKPDTGGLDAKAFQNLGYTGEWFVFAGFALFMWFRFVRKEAEVQRDLAMGLVPEDDDPFGGGGGAGPDDGPGPGDDRGGDGAARAGAPADPEAAPAVPSR